MADDMQQAPPDAGAQPPAEPAAQESFFDPADSFSNSIADALAKAGPGNLIFTEADAKAAKDAEPAAPAPASEPAAPAEPASPAKGADVPAADEIPKGMTPKAAKAFASYRKDLDAANKAKADLEAKIKDYESRMSGIDPAAADKIKQEYETKLSEREKQLADYENRLRLTNLTESKEYRTSVVEPLGKIESLANGLGTKYAIAPSKILEALNERDELKQSDLLSDVTAGFNDWDKNKLYSLMKDYQGVLDLKSKMFEDTKATLEVINDRRRKQQEEMFNRYKTDYDKSLNESWSFLEDKVPVLRSEDAGVKEIVGKLKDQAAKIDVIRMSPRDRAFMVNQALIAPLLAQAYAKQSQELADATKKLNGIKKATPTATGGGAGSSQPKAVDEEVSFADSIAKLMGG